MTETLFPTSSSAVLSPCGVYRYRLSRTWDDTKPPAVWVMLNPSTADADQDDPTIRRCIGFARAWGQGGIEVVNLFALRATDPKELRVQRAVSIGPDNDAAILAAASRGAGEVVLAWGTHGSYLGRDMKVAALLTTAGIGLRCLGRTKRGHPRHPLYCPAGLVPVRWG